MLESELPMEIAKSIRKSAAQVALISAYEAMDKALLSDEESKKVARIPLRIFVRC